MNRIKEILFIKYRESMKCMVFFALYMFLYLFTELYVCRAAAQIMDNDAATFLYGSYMLATAIGFVLFSLSRGGVRTTKGRKHLLTTEGAIFLLSIAAIAVTNGFILIMIVTIICAQALGYLGAAVYYTVAIRLAESHALGKVIGASVSGALVIQYIVQKFFPRIGWEAFILVIAFVVFFAYWYLFSPTEISNHMVSTIPKQKRDGYLLVAAVACMTLIIVIADSALSIDSNDFMADLASWPRLFYALGAFVAGALADLPNRNIMNGATVAALYLCTLFSIFGNNIADVDTLFCFFYFAYGFYVVFLTWSFMRLAPTTESPDLWAGMGRMTRSIVTAMTVLPTVLVTRLVGMSAIRIMAFILVVVVAVIFVLGCRKKTE